VRQRITASWVLVSLNQVAGLVQEPGASRPRPVQLRRLPAWQGRGAQKSISGAGLTVKLAFCLRCTIATRYNDAGVNS
jgi:hypothetical protein